MLFEPRHPFREMAGMERPWFQNSGPKAVGETKSCQILPETSRGVYRKHSLLFRVREASVWYVLNLLSAQLYTVYVAAWLLNQSILPIISCSTVATYVTLLSATCVRDCNTQSSASSSENFGLNFKTSSIQ